MTPGPRVSYVFMMHILKFASSRRCLESDVLTGSMMRWNSGPRLGKMTFRGPRLVQRTYFNELSCALEIYGVNYGNARNDRRIYNAFVLGVDVVSSLSGQAGAMTYAQAHW